jgi:hypothetical protein
MENELPNPGRIPKENDLVALCRALNEHEDRFFLQRKIAESQPND